MSENTLVQVADGSDEPFAGFDLMEFPLDRGEAPVTLAGLLMFHQGLYWDSASGQAYCALVDKHHNKVKLYATGLYFDQPWNKVTRATAAQCAALVQAMGLPATLVKTRWNNWEIHTVHAKRQGDVIRLSVGQLASQIGRYAYLQQPVHGYVLALQELLKNDTGHEAYIELRALVIDVPRAE